MKKELKPRTRKQHPLKEGSEVYFMGFTKNKDTGPLYYLCKAVVTGSPSPFNKAPHKLKITAVSLSKMHKGGNEEDGRSLLGKEISLPIDKLNPELQPWLTPETWWI